MVLVWTLVGIVSARWRARADGGTADDSAERGARSRCLRPRPVPAAFALGGRHVCDLTFRRARRERVDPVVVHVDRARRSSVGQWRTSRLVINYLSGACCTSGAADTGTHGTGQLATLG